MLPKDITYLISNFCENDLDFLFASEFNDPRLLRKLFPENVSKASYSAVMYWMQFEKNVDKLNRILNLAVFRGNLGACIALNSQIECTKNHFVTALYEDHGMLIAWMSSTFRKEDVINEYSLTLAAKRCMFETWKNLICCFSITKEDIIGSPLFHLMSLGKVQVCTFVSVIFKIEKNDLLRQAVPKILPRGIEFKNLIASIDVIMGFGYLKCRDTKIVMCQTP